MYRSSLQAAAAEAARVAAERAMEKANEAGTVQRHKMHRDMWAVPGAPSGP